MVRAAKVTLERYGLPEILDLPHPTPGRVPRSLAASPAEILT